MLVSSLKTFALGILIRYTKQTVDVEDNTSRKNNFSSINCIQNMRISFRYGETFSKYKEKERENEKKGKKEIKNKRIKILGFRFLM